VVERYWKKERAIEPALTKTGFYMARGAELLVTPDAPLMPPTFKGRILDFVRHGIVAMRPAGGPEYNWLVAFENSPVFVAGQRLRVSAINTVKFIAITASRGYAEKRCS
jgi:hypothetical protein